MLLLYGACQKKKDGMSFGIEGNRLKRNSELSEKEMKV